MEGRNMKQFSLEEYLANPWRKLVTRDGRPVRILCTDRKSYNVGIVGLIMNDNGMESVFTWTQQGKRYLNMDWTQQGKRYLNMDTPNDLFFAPEKHIGWINVYRNSGRVKERFYTGAAYDSKEDAEKHKESGENYVTTIKIEWEE